MVYNAYGALMDVKKAWETWDAESAFASHRREGAVLV